MDRKELIRKAIASVRPEDVTAVKNQNYPVRIYVDRQASAKQIRNAIDSYAYGCAPEDVAVLVEETILGSGKKGYLFTAEAMFYDKSGLNRKKLPMPLLYDQIEQVELDSNNTSHLIFSFRDGRQVNVFAGIRGNFLRLAFQAVLSALAGVEESDAVSRPDPEPVSVPVPDPDPDSASTPAQEAVSVEEPQDENYIRGMELFQSERYEEAYPLIKKCSQPEAVAVRGWMLENGKGIRKNKKTAESFYLQAASQGNREGMLGVLRTGGIPESVEQAKERLEFARLLVLEGYQEAEPYRESLETAIARAEQEAQIKAECEKLFQDGMQAYKAGNYTSALTCFKKAAGMGNVEAQFKCGQMYYNGEGVKQDDAEAMNWFMKAAEQNHAWAQFYCGLMYTYGKSVMSSDRKALSWYRKSAEQGVARSQFQCGVMYYKGEGTDTDRDEARMWLEKAADQGYEKAIELLQKYFNYR